MSSLVVARLRLVTVELPLLSCLRPTNQLRVLASDSRVNKLRRSRSHTTTYCQLPSRSWCQAHLGRNTRFLLPSFAFKSQSALTTDGQSASQSWCQTPSGTQDQIFVTVTQLRVCWCGRAIWWEDASAVHNSCWPSPAQTFSVPSLAGLMTTTIFYCLRFDSRF
jgi:hypothetical protein